MFNKQKTLASNMKEMNNILNKHKHSKYMYSHENQKEEEEEKS